MANTMNGVPTHVVVKNWRYESRYSVSLIRDGVGWFRHRDANRQWAGPWVVVR